MTSHAPEKKGERLKFRSVVFGLLSIFPRLPSIVLTMREMMGLDDSAPLSLGSVMERNARDFPDDTALLYEERRYSHLEFNQAINRYAHYFQSQGVGEGDVVIVLVENRPELLMIIAALAKIGAVSSLINPNLRGEVLRYSIDLTRERHHIVGEELLAAFEEVRARLKSGKDSRFYFSPDGSATEAPDGYVHLGNAVSRQPAENPATTAGVRINQPFAYVFTSGTTGLPKASIQTHRRWFMGQYWFGKIVMNLKTEDVFYCPLPFCHTNGLNVAWGAAAARGTALAVRRKFSATHFLDDVRRYNATAFIYIGEICRYLINQPRRPDDADNPLVSCVGNGLRPEIWTLFKERFGLKKVYELYGSAEGTLIFTNLLNLDRTVGMCLTPYAIVKYDIDADAPVRNDAGFMMRVAPGEQGLLIAEISEKLPFAGYTERRETEKKIFRDVFVKGDRWFNFGDLVLHQGYKHIRFVDRLGDTYRWKGENVSTTEVEKAVNSDEQVSASTVYGVAIPGTEGRAGMIALIPDRPFEAFDFKKFSRRIRQQLPSYAVPKFIRMKSEFDTTGTHKIKKTTLREEGFDMDRISDPLFVLLPGKETYTPMTPEIYEDILKGKYKF